MYQGVRNISFMKNFTYVLSTFVSLLLTLSNIQGKNLENLLLFFRSFGNNLVIFELRLTF